MSVRFYTAPTGGDPVGPTLSFPDTPLVDGIFQLTLSLNDLQMNQVFGSGDHEVYVEVASQDKIYPRQKFLAVPYALRIPVDGDTLTYGTNGRLTVGSISQSQVSGLALALSAKADANTVAATLAGKADTASVTNQLAAKADATALATKAAVNATLSGDVSGALNGPITVDKIKNTALPTPNPSQDGGKYLQYNGAEYVLSTISGSSGGTVTSVTASLPLSVTNGSTTPALTLSVASGVSDGYLTSSDFTAFNNKQSAITTSSTVNAGTLTTEQQNGLQIKPYSSTAGATGEVRLTELAAGGTEYVGFKAPDSIAVSRIWTLPALDGSDGQVLKTNGAGILSWVSPGNSGTVTSVNLTAPTNGITVTGGPITSSGSIFLSLADDLAAVEALSTTGGVERTGANTWGTYTLTAAGKALLDDVDATAQRTTLGLGTLATASSVSGGTAGTIADDSITDADINASAGIAQSKILGLTTSLSGKEPTIAAGTTTQYYRGDKTWQTLGSDIVTEGTTNLYFTNTRARNALSVSGGLLSYNSSTGVISLTSTGSTSGTGGGAASNPSSGCPSGYILVPGDTDYGTTDFCVMKYEAKFGDKGAESRAAGLPARGTISQNTALAACRNLGPGYALINNAEWMTIAANVANVASNWSGNAVGSGALNRGHSDNDPAIALAASTDSSACSGTNQTCSDTSWNDQRRTHKLSNNNVIWDLAGNVWEWVDYNNYEDKPSAAAAWAEYTAVSSSTTMAKTSLVPTKAQKSWWTDTWNGATNGIGQYYAGTNGSGGALLRGGNWSSAAIAGVFTAILNNGPSLTFTDIGFRCVFRPASP
jgi:hypothetical protein